MMEPEDQQMKNDELEGDVTVEDATRTGTGIGDDADAGDIVTAKEVVAEGRQEHDNKKMEDEPKEAVDTLGSPGLQQEIHVQSTDKTNVELKAATTKDPSDANTNMNADPLDEERDEKVCQGDKEELGQVEGEGAPVHVEGEGGEDPAQVTSEGAPTSMEDEEAPTHAKGEGAPMHVEGDGAPTHVHGEDPSQVTSEGAPTRAENEGAPTNVEGEGAPTYVEGEGTHVPVEGAPVLVEGGEAPIHAAGEGTPTQVESQNGEREAEEPAGAAIAEPQEAQAGNLERENGAMAEQAGDLQEPALEKDTEVTDIGSKVTEEAVEVAEQSQSEDEQAEDTQPKIPLDFFYKYEEHVSKARVAEESDLPSDMLTLCHSFGYDCKRLSNIHMLDANTLIFAAGNVVQLLNIHSKEQKYIRTTGGGGVGAITVHPSSKYFAVCEKGSMPDINMYKYPSLKLYRILREGTETAYAFADFNPAGTLLASVGSAPDYMLTVWDWLNETIVLRSKAFSQDVFRVTFSPDNEGLLTTSGTGHIRFWKMAHTFTGLKLQGQLGKFGRTEISDIHGYVELPDGKVLSGAEWGNMLLWEGGLIKVQISRKNKKPCHNGNIEQFVVDEGELISIGADGYIRVWDFETVDAADSVNESGIFEMDCMNELKVSNDVHLMSMVKSLDPEVQSIWYAQDANGAIWKLDLSFSHTTKDPERLFSFHAGEITAIDTSPVSHLLASAALDYTVRVFDYASQMPICSSKFNAGATTMLWVPPTIDPKGSTILAGFSDGVVRALTIKRRDNQDAKRSAHHQLASLSLKQAFKPHTKAVSAMAIDSKGEILTTAGADNTLFFMNVGDLFTPIGFIDTPGPVTHLTWSPSYFDKNCVLVFCANGEVLEVEAPDEPGSFDTSTTFRISGLKTRQTTFKSIKSRLKREEEEEQKRKEEEARQKELERKRRIRRERGLNDEEDEDDKKELQEEKEPPPLYIPEEPSPIHYGVYSPDDPDTFWVSMGAFDAGYLYECKFHNDKEKADIIKQGREEAINEAIRTIPIIDSNDVPIRTMQFTGDGKYVLFGMENGAIQIHQVGSGDKTQDHIPDHSQADLSAIGPYWSLTVHDNNYGHVTGVKRSFDGRFIFTCGADGNLFVFELLSEVKIEEARALAKAKIPSARKEDEDRKVSDIENKEHYSIELEKQKSEHDKMMRKAEEKKTDVRRTIAKQRRQFKKLLEQNQELPEHLQLQRKEFEMDPGIRKELEKQTKDKIELVRRELAWEAEKHRISLEKLRTRFKEELECERIVVIAIQTDHEVSTYRTTALPSEFHEMKQEYTRRTAMMSDKSLQHEATRKALTGQLTLADSMTDASLGDGTRDVKKSTILTGRHGEKVAKALQKAEKTRQKRLAREKQWQELLSSKPPEEYEDPADVSAIKHAQDHMGDFKLKTAKDYSVPEHLRMNALKKRNQLVILEELIHKYKSEFNRRLVELRDKKIRIIQEIQQHLVELSDIEKVLGDEHQKPLPDCPQLYPCETPEKRLEYTRETLMEFKAQMAEKAILEKTGGDTGAFGFGGFGGGGAGVAPDQKEKESSTPLSYRHSSMLSVKSRPVSFTDSTIKLSPLEQQLIAMEEIRLLNRHDELIIRINELIVSFDTELRMLRHEKIHMDTDLKNGDLRRVTLFEELQLLKEFEKRENVLAAKVEGKIKERSDSQVKVAECQQKLDSKRKDIDRLIEKEKALYANFQASLGENNKFAEFLTKVFKKKIKRAKKKKAQTEEGSDEESEESSEDESDWSSDEEDSEEEGLDDSVCPPGCDQALFDNTCALREKRLDFEELLAEEKKVAEGLKKEVDALTKKQKVIENNLKTAEADLEAFQLEKQQKLNELDVVVTLRLHQVEHMVNGAVPQDLSQTLVFSNASMAQLQRRIQELKEEKTAQRRHYKEHRQQHVQLINDRKLMESHITELEEKCNEMMRQKFGRIIDLEKLETVGVNRTVEELKEKLRLNELTNGSELQKWDSKIEAKKARITELIEENTLRLQHLTMLVGENKTLEKALDARQTNLGGEYQGSRKADLEERGRLIQLVQLQAQEIEALKDEISLLSRKGGHILPPTQPPIQPKSAHKHPPGNPGQ